MARILRRARRGAEAVEFALVAPLLIGLAFGSIDYGLYFWQQTRATIAVNNAMRAGGLTAPPDEELGQGSCSTCQDVVQNEAANNLAAAGIDVPDVRVLRPDVIGVGPSLASGRVCALRLDLSLPYTPITGMFQVPESYTIRAQVVAQGAKGC